MKNKDFKKLLRDANTDGEVLAIVSEMINADIDIDDYLGVNDPLYLKTEMALASIMAPSSLRYVH